MPKLRGRGRPDSCSRQGWAHAGRHAAARQLTALRGVAAADAPVFASRSGKPLERSRVLRIVKDASQRPGIAANVSTHWLRRAHVSHALDHGAPIDLVQATLGRRSVATTSRHLHARPGESSAGYLFV
jgi:integrase/recombinase XerD